MVVPSKNFKSDLIFFGKARSPEVHYLGYCQGISHKYDTMPKRLAKGANTLAYLSRD